MVTGYGDGLAINRSRVRIPVDALPSATLDKLFTRTCASVTNRVRTIVQKSDSPIVDSIGQNNRPMRWRCDSFSASITVKQ